MVATSISPYADGTTGDGFVDNSGGVGGGFVQQWDLPPSWGKLSYVQIGPLYGWGLVDFDPSDVNLDKLVNAYNSALAADGNSPVRGTFEDVDPYNNSQRARANIFWVWNPTDNFSLGTWATYQFDDQGFTSYQVNSNGSISSASRLYASLYCGHQALLLAVGSVCDSRFIRLRLSLEQSKDGGRRSAREARWASSRSPRPSNQEGASSPVLSCAPSRPSPYGLTSSRAPLEVHPTPTKTTDGSLESKLRHGGKQAKRFA